MNTPDTAAETEPASQPDSAASSDDGTPQPQASGDPAASGSELGPLRPLASQGGGPRRWLGRLLVLAAVVGLGYLGAREVWRPEPIEVEVLPVVRGVVDEAITNSSAGTVEARLRTQLSPEVSGRVVEIPRREGNSVAAGELLLRLDDSVLQARLRAARMGLESAQAAQAQAEARAQRASRELERKRRLSEVISEDVLDELAALETVAKAAADTARARARQAEAELAVLAAELERTRLRAPFTGILAELKVEVGEWITPSPPMLSVPGVIDLLDPRTNYVSAPMDEVDSARIETGQRVRVTLDPFPNQSFPGRVVRVADYVLDVEAQNRTVEIEVELDDAELAARLLPGTSADVEVILQTRPDVLRIPAAALLAGDRALVVEEGLLVERELEIGLRNWEFCEVLGGLSEGERVVTSLDRLEVQAGAPARARDGSTSEVPGERQAP